MTKPHGFRLGSYEVSALIGVGGMGEVYRARDTRLDRDVAVKLLPEELMADPERRARFDREARVLASLSHPNIAAIFGVEETADGTVALVLELVQGQTLAERLYGGALPIPDALSIGRQIAAALAAAHDVGVVHRDIKPQNVKVRPDGCVKVLDFGVAKILDPSSPGGSGGSLPTIAANKMTQAGTVLGTPAYMSPEQTRARAIDKRADVWAFGCVLYEMLTGRRAFGGDDVPDTIASVLRGEPDWSLLPPGLPQSVSTLLRRCLEKDPARRLRDIGDVSIMIEEATPSRGVAAVPSGSAPTGPTAIPQPSGIAAKSRYATAKIAAGVAAAVAIGAATLLYLRSGPEAVDTESSTQVQSTVAPTPDAPPAPVARDARSGYVAVLPFDNQGSSADDASFAAGLHDAVLNQLANLRSLRVISRTSVLRYTDSRLSIPEIARELGVGAIMEGSVRYAGDQLIVQAQLIDAATDFQLWSRTFQADRSEIRELFSIQNEIATAIADALGAEISTDDRSRIERTPTASVGAYRRYLQARDFNSRGQVVDAMRELDRVIDIDPDFAEAYAQRAYSYAYAQITSIGRGALLSQESLRGADFEALALENAERAIALYDGVGLAWVARAVTHEFHLRMTDAREAFDRALEIDPNDQTILQEYALFQAYMGNPTGALTTIRRAAALNPKGVTTLTFYAQLAAATGNTDEANAALESALAVDAPNAFGNALAGAFASDATRARDFLRRAEDLAVGTDAMFLPAVARGYLTRGLEGDAERVLDRYETWATGWGIGAADWAQYYLMRGDLDQTHTWLERTIETLERGEADSGFFALMETFTNRTSPRLADSRFQLLLDRLDKLRSD